MHLVTNWVFWVGVVLAAQGIAVLFLMGRYKYYRIKTRRQRDIRMTIRKTHNAAAVGHNPCRYDGGVWHPGKCTPFACPSANNHPMGAVLHHANR